MSPTPPRLYAICAMAAPVAAVIARRGRWVLVARWDLDRGRVEHGSWFRGTIYQRRCEISPDGVWFYYFALKGGRAFDAVSRLPWLTALALWKQDTTYGGGAEFQAAARARKLPGTAFSDPADLGSIAPLTKQHQLRLASRRNEPYAAERARGWLEHPDASPRLASDPFDEHRPQWLVRDQPRGSGRLELRDRGYQRGHLEGRAPTYALDGQLLEGVVWADWDARGRLLVATRAGCLEIRDADHLCASTSLTEIAADPQASPPRAHRW